MEFFSIGFGAIFVYNFVLAQFLGLCPFIGVSKKMSSAVGMGMAVTFVMTTASIVTFFVYILLKRLNMEAFLDIVVFILVIASFVQLVEMIIQKARELFPEAKPKVISDNGPQFIAKDFKEFIRIAGMKHVRTAPYYPQSNGKIERWHRTIKSECIRPGVMLSLDDARAVVNEYIRHYNEPRLNSAIGYVSPKAKLEDREKRMFKERDAKLEAAREARRIKRRGKNAA